MRFPSFVVVVVVFCAFASVGRCGMSRKDRRTILAVHNQLRSDVALGKVHDKTGRRQPPAANMHQLTWSRRLAKGAQKWANKCDFHHSSRQDRGQTGESLAGRGSDIRVERMVRMWYSEINTHSLPSVDKFTRDLLKQGVGHYSQLVWGKTTKIGCGLRLGCHMWGYSKIGFLVCRYSPVGNMIGHPFYQVGKPCSGCETKCDPHVGLCK